MRTAAIKKRKNVVVIGSRVLIKPLRAIGKTPHMNAVDAAKRRPNFHRPDRLLIEMSSGD
jgi:hypothetical protein